MQFAKQIEKDLVSIWRDMSNKVVLIVYSLVFKTITLIVEIQYKNKQLKELEEKILIY